MEKNELPTAAILGVFGVIALLLMLGTGLLNPLLDRLVLPSPTPSATSLPIGGGGLIAFESWRDGNPEIYVLSTDGSYKKNLTDDPANDWAQVWSPDGSRIAFLSQRTGSSQVFVIKADGSGLTQLTGSREDADWSGPLSWSPDGTRIVATAYITRLLQWKQSLLYLIQADGSGSEPLNPYPDDQYNDSRPKWSPDGEHIAYLSYRYTTTGLYVIDLETRKQVTLSVSGSRYIPVFDWYPDGTQVAYLSVATMPNNLQSGTVFSSALRVVDVEGKNDRLLDSFEQAHFSDETLLAWSPDGSRLVLAADLEQDANGNRSGSQLYHLWADGSGLVALMGATSDSSSLSWSPDGKWIGFTSSQSGGSNIYLMNANEFYQSPGNRSVVRLTGSGKDQNPQWQPGQTHVIVAPFPIKSQSPAQVTPTTQPAEVVLSPIPTPGETLAASPAAPGALLADLNVRQGIAYCTNRDELVSSVYPWWRNTIPAPFAMDSFLPDGHWAYPQVDPAFVRYPFDPERGEALFEKAGWTLAPGAAYRTNASGEEMRLTLTTSDSQFRQTWTSVFVAQMKDCGLRIQRILLPADQLYAEDGPLQRREFEIAGLALVSQPDPDVESMFACTQIPTLENGWQGGNYSGWCDPTVEQAISTLSTSLEVRTRQEAYRLIQESYNRELPALPLFARPQFFAVNPTLENFDPDLSGLSTWNAAQWAIPGKDTIVIGERSEPATLFQQAENAYVVQLIGNLIYGADYANRNYTYQPVMLKQIPSVENGGVTVNRVEVGEGANVVDADGKAVELHTGVQVRDAQGNQVVYAGGRVAMDQLSVKFEYVNGLTWSDGVPVAREDYELAYRITCDPALYLENYAPGLPPVCEVIDRVDFVSDTAYVVTWKPGFQKMTGEPLYFLPPFGRQPAHRVVEGGQRLGDVPASQWPGLDEVNRNPLGVGPYVVSQWKYGESMLLTANPYYYLGKPATTNLLIRFIPQADTAAYLVQGRVDLLDYDSILPDQIDTLLEAQSAGKVRVYFIPSPTYELLDFALRGK